MQIRVLFAAAIVSVLAGCGPAVGNLTVSWTFSDGDNCANVDHVQIAIPGQALANSGTFACTDGSETFAAVTPGTYQVAITAVDAAGNALYQGSSTVTVNGNVSTTVVLSPTSTGQTNPGQISLGWSFSDGQDDCGVIDHIHIDLPGQTLPNGGDVPCQTDFVDAALLTGIAPGTYQATVSGRDSSGVVLYQGTTPNFTVDPGGMANVKVTLSPTGVIPQSGNIDVVWSFGDGSSCASNGVAQIKVQIPGQTLGNNGLYGCTNSGAQGVTLDNFAAGSYDVEVSALDGSGNVLYQGSTTVEVNGDVTATVSLAPLVTTQPGNINLLWSFGDGSTCGSNGVAQVQVQIPGETLDNGGLYGCTNSGTQGITLTNFAAGSYDVQVSALDASGNVLYQGSTTVDVNGDVTANVALAAVASPGNITLTWSFGDGSTCGSNGVAQIQVQIPGQTLGNNGLFACSTNGTQGITIDNFAAGSYDVQVSALDGSGNVLYQGSTTVDVNGDVSANVSLAAVAASPGNITLTWSFPNSANCTSAGVSQVVVTIPGQTLANNGDFACETNGTQGIVLNSFAPGTYEIDVSAQTASGTQISSGSASVTVNGDVSVSMPLQ